MELFQWLDGEATANRARQLEAHVAGCPACRRELTAQQRLVGRLSEPPKPPDERDVQAVMARLRAQPPVRRTLWSPGWRAGLAAACVAMLGAALWLARPERTPDLFAARGAGHAHSLERHVGVELLSAGAPPVRLRSGVVLPLGTPLFAHYRNLGETPAFLLLFAQDAAGELHWLYPAYLVAGEEPRSVELVPSVRETAMPEAVVLEAPAAGPLRVFALVSARPLSVLEVEHLGKRPLTEERLRAHWPEASLTLWTLLLQEKP
jgi:hypothetical protein